MPRTPRFARLGELPQDVVAGLMAVGVVDALEEIDVEDEQANLPVAGVGPGHQALEMGLQIAAVVEAGQRIGDRELDGAGHDFLQLLGRAAPAQLGAHPGAELGHLDGPDDVVVHAEVERAQQVRCVSRHR